MLTPTVEALREVVDGIQDADGGNPRVHPNGFIQLDLEDVPASWHASHQRGHSGASRRLHIWNPPGIELPHQETVNEIHDHVFDMRSTVIRGVLTQRLYHFITGIEARFWTHELYRAIYAKSSDSRLEPLKVYGMLEQINSFEIEEGSSYTQSAFTLHDSDPQGELVVTVMEKTEILPGDATVVCEFNKPPDNSYDRQNAAPTELLWEAIARALA